MSSNYITNPRLYNAWPLRHLMSTYFSSHLTPVQDVEGPFRCATKSSPVSRLPSRIAVPVSNSCPTNSNVSRLVLSNPTTRLLFLTGIFQSDAMRKNAEQAARIAHMGTVSPASHSDFPIKPRGEVAQASILSKQVPRFSFSIQVPHASHLCHPSSRPSGNSMGYDTVPAVFVIPLSLSRSIAQHEASPLHAYLSAPSTVPNAPRSCAGGDLRVPSAK
ncbi:hypothetical protein IWX47DRAFT_352778 [Phyllosticta citricarpa]